MSSRRAAGEDNILAMLERDSARRTGSRMSSLRLAWYGAAAAFAGILAGGVAWLAYDNHKSAAQLQAEYEADVANVAAVDKLATVPPVPPVPADAGAPMLPVPAGELPRAAVIVDESPPAARTGAGTVPPLVMLPQHELAQARAAAQAPPRAAEPRTVPPLVMLPRADTAPARPAARPAPRKPHDIAGAAPAKPRSAQGTARTSADKKAEKAGKSDKMQRAAKPASARNTNKTVADTSRQRKPAGAAPQVDSDVALISAIIAQSERHRGAREATQACKGAACPPSPAQP